MGANQCVKNCSFSTLCCCTSVLHIFHLKKEVLKTTFMPVKGISNVEIVFRDQNIFYFILFGLPDGEQYPKMLVGFFVMHFAYF